MIKKGIALSLALLYTVTVLGFAINFHYCFNRVSSVSIDQPVKKCSTDRVVKAMKCCKDKHVDVKVKDGHQNSSLWFLAKNVVSDLPRVPFEAFLPAICEASITQTFDRGPPVDQRTQPSIYLANRNFRI